MIRYAAMFILGVYVGQDRSTPNVRNILFDESKEVYKKIREYLDRV
jgi:hypothetical protein